MSGVIPPFLQAVFCSFQQVLRNGFGHSASMSWLAQIGVALEQGPLHIVLYSLAIFFFSFFYTALVFNPKDTADNLKKSGAFIPGIRPGEQTANYIDTVMTRCNIVWCYLCDVGLLVTAIYDAALECPLLFWWYFIVDYCCCCDGFYVSNTGALNVAPV